MKKYTALSLGFLLLSIIVFYRSFFIAGNIPIPTDTLVNLFHPLRDYFIVDYPRGVPFKNSLISDPVIQQIPWKDLSVSLLSSGQLPLWNPYQMVGYPLLGNIQSSPYYPLNFIMMLLPFITGWSLFIMLQQVLAAVFMYLFLRNRNLSYGASVIGGFSFAFSGFVISWLEWGTIIHTALWLPLALLAIDAVGKSKQKVWLVILAAAVICSYLGGHLQTFIYSLATILLYSVFRYKTKEVSLRYLIYSFGCIIGSLLILLPVWLPQFQFISLSARGIDQDWHQPGFFIPVQHIVQFIAPNFFGNPATGNYWGEWNYGEFIGYIGIFPLLLGLVALFNRRTKDIYFWTGTIVLFGISAFQNPLATIPYQFSFPFISSTQPTRAIFIIDIALVILAAYGFDEVVKAKKRMIKPQLVLIVLLALLMIGGFIAYSSGMIKPEQWQIVLRNQVIPIALVILSCAGVFLASLLSGTRRHIVLLLLIGITISDLFYFANKYTPFSSKEFYYPLTTTIKYLQDHTTTERIMTTDRRILHPNISTLYRLQSVDGYDPLYLLRYGELMIANARNKADISPPFGFKRIITPQDPTTSLMNLLGVKYVLSLTELDNPTLVKVHEEGETKVYENRNAFPRTFFVSEIVPAVSKHDALNKIFSLDTKLREIAVVEDTEFSERTFSIGTALIKEYTPNSVLITTSNEGLGFLILSDSHYPTWRVFIDGKEGIIYRTDYHLRGVLVPEGQHTVEFKNSLL